MARLQIVTLPTLTVGAVSSPEYLIVLDEVDGELVKELVKQTAGIKESTGARGVLAFESTIEVVHESSVSDAVPAWAAAAHLNRML